MGKKRKKVRRTGPDESFGFGPFEFARYGRFILGKSNAGPEQFEAAQKVMAERLPQVEAELDELVRGIAERIGRLPPSELLKRGWWEMGMAFSGMEPQKADTDRSLNLRMVDYVQSLIAATPRSDEQLDQLGDADWVALKADVGTLFERVTLEYQMCRTASLKAQDPSLDMELEEFRFRAEVLWTNVRGKRYHVHEREALLEVVAPHSDELDRVFGITAEALVDEVAKLLNKFTHGMQDTIIRLDGFRTRTLERFAALAELEPELDVEALRQRVFQDAALAQERDAVMGDLFGLGLFDISKNTNLPQRLVDELSWSPGEDVEFLAPGPFAGWPLRVWPTMKRPFIRLDSRAYCFDIFSLFDNLYRVLQRAILRLDPDYRTRWNERQKAVSEELPFKYLGRLLPGCDRYNPVYYRWKVGEGAAQWHEADGLIIFDDHLLVIEVKAGAFTYTSPANDLPAHIASLRNLVQSPASQGARFVDYLESATEVGIADASHNEIGRLRRSQFRHVTICAVTLDAFSDLAARAQHLKGVGIDVGARPVWVVSIDDLRAYADLFNSPLTFLHFLEQRAQAAQSALVNLHDEMDHFGLYNAENNYARFAEELADGQVGRLNFDGYRDKADDYFAAVLKGEAGPPPKQPTPARIAEIVDLLDRRGAPGGSELASHLLDWAGDFREQIAAGIDEQLDGNRRLKRSRPLSTYGEVCTTVQVWSPDAPPKPGDGVDHTRAVMALNGETERRLIELEYGATGDLISARSEIVTLAGLDAEALARAESGAENIRRRRLETAQAAAKIGRNDSCPCGSGRKYKHCCRP
jgi:preprotein translocase subunit SecA